MTASNAGLASPTRPAVLWGLVVGIVTLVAAPLFWWLDLSMTYALTITLIAAVYVGFAVADGRPNVIVIEAVVASLFVVLATVAMTESAWLLVIGYVAHGLKDLWQHRSHYVANTRWWPPFCCAVDWLVAGGLAIMIVSGVGFH